MCLMCWRCHYANVLYKFVQRHYWTAPVLDRVRWALEGNWKQTFSR